jgi:hypothetical protein
MPRKAAAAGEPGGSALEPRRSSRIKDQPKQDQVVKKAPAKPRAKKGDKEKQEGEADKGEKPKSSRGKKRKEPETTETNGAAPEAEAEGGEPPAKKVRAPRACSIQICLYNDLFPEQTFFCSCCQAIVKGV